MKKSSLLIICSIIMLTTSCKSLGEKQIEHRAQELSEYVEKEKELGRAAFAKLAGKYGVLKDEETTEYLNKLGKALSLYVERHELEYYFAILDSEQINGYALPGGYILITKGALKHIDTKGALLGVLAHELGHINKKHVLQGVKIETKQNFFETLARILAGPRQIITNVVNQVSQKIEEKLFIEGLAAEDEFEADQYAVELLQAIGLSALEYAEYIQKLSTITETEEMANLDKTHPDINQRITKINAILEANLPLATQTDNYRNFKNKLSQL